MVGVVIGVQLFAGLAIAFQFDPGGVTGSKISVSNASSSKAFPSKAPYRLILKSLNFHRKTPPGAAASRVGLYRSIVADSWNCHVSRENECPRQN